jgi:ferritin
MLSKKMETALNGQMTKEFYSAYLYLSMSAACTSMGLKGGANWFSVQNLEEMVHFNKFYTFVLDRGGKVTLDKVEKPPSEFPSLANMYEQALKHEQFITASINDLVDLARKENDHATEVFLQWFVTEQVEEEANASDVLARLNLAGKEGLFLVDKDLGTRVFTPPPAAGADAAG